jgi:hypothetical protein
MTTETSTPLTDQAEQLYHERSATYAVRDLCRKLEQTSLNEAEAKLVKDLIELYHAAWNNPHGRLCECELCEATERAGEHKSKTFDSLSKKCGVQP